MFVRPTGDERAPTRAPASASEIEACAQRCACGRKGRCAQRVRPEGGQEPAFKIRPRRAAVFSKWQLDELLAVAGRSVPRGTSLISEGVPRD